jgi:2,3-bisphosphoglycerate-dependent phosphoglycerate mutase
MRKLVLIRHGESEWNRLNNFTGWVDVALSERGVEEAREAGKILLTEKYSFDVAFTSLLKRARDTLKLVVETMKIQKLPIIEAWQLNERHYGALQGLNKAGVLKRHGEELFNLWRRSYDVPPPPLDTSSWMFPGNDPIYADVPPEKLPRTESLKDVVARVVPFWEKEIVPEMRSGKCVLIVAHGNSLRALIKHLDCVSDEAITSLNLPYAIPLVYEMDEALHPLKHYYLGDQEKIQKLIEEVAGQGRK